MHSVYTPGTPATAPTPDWRSIALALFVAASLMFALSGPMTSNELDTLQTARRFADPTYLAGDWFLGLDQGPRRPFQLLVWPLASTLPLLALSIAGRLLGFLLLSAGLARLAARLGIGPALAVTLGGVYVGWQQNIGGGEWLFGQIESKVVAYGLLLFGLDAWLAGKKRRSGVLFGAATTLHVLVGAQATLALGLVAVWHELAKNRRPGAGQELRDWRALGPPLLLWTLCALPGLWILALAATDHVVHDPPISWIYVVFRTPHHSNPLAWKLSWRDYTLVATLLAVLWVVPRWHQDRPEMRTLARFGLAALVPFTGGLIASQLPDSHRYLQLLPFRVGGVMLPLIALLLVGAVVALRLPRLPQTWLARLGALFTLVAAGQAAASQMADLRDFPEGGRPPLPRTEALAQRDAALWIRAHTQPGQGVLAAPTWESVGYLAQRPVAVTYKQTPPGHKELALWLARIQALAGGQVSDARGHAMLGDLDARFEHLPATAYQDLGRRYGCAVVLLRRNDLTLQRLYRNGHWTVYALDAPHP